MEEFFQAPETEIILRFMSEGKDSRSQIPFSINETNFNLSFVYQWLYIWGLSFPKLAKFLEVSEEPLFESIKDLVEKVKNKINLTDAEEINKTSELVVASLPHTLTALPFAFEE